tara:strand:- start:7168 stop:8139 length:972 start_codon:yes stop_codon:yes gene_type:complete
MIKKILFSNKNLKKGRIITKQDFNYKNSKKISSLYVSSYSYILKNFILKNDIKKDTILKKIFLKKPNIAAIIACRLKSERLRKKAVIKVDREDTVIDKCIKSCKNLKSNNMVILATSKIDEDKLLEYSAKKNKVIFYQGHSEDVIKRYLSAANKFKIDIILRVTGDCPYISSEISELILKDHINKGADYSEAKEAPIGASCQVINTSALKKILLLKKNTPMSEYMKYYFTNNPRYFKINYVSLPSWMKKNYRMTVDYIEDIRFFEKIYGHLFKSKKKLSLQNIFNYLKKNSKVVQINSAKKLKYKSNKVLIKKLYKETKIFEI